MSGISQSRPVSQHFYRSNESLGSKEEGKSIGNNQKSSNQPHTAIELLDMSMPASDSQRITQPTSEQTGSLPSFQELQKGVNPNQSFPKPEHLKKNEGFLKMFGKLPDEKNSSKSQKPPMSELKRAKQEKINQMFGLESKIPVGREGPVSSKGGSIDQRQRDIALIFGLQDTKNDHVQAFREKERQFMNAPEFEPILLNYSIDVTSAVLTAASVKKMIESEAPLEPEVVKQLTVAAEDAKNMLARGDSEATVVKHVDALLHSEVSFKNLSQVKELVKNLETHLFMDLEPVLTAGLEEGRVDNLEDEVRQYDQLIDNLDKTINDKNNGLSKDERSLLTAMKNHVRIGARDKVKTLYMGKLKQELAHFKKSGASKETSISISIGVGASVFGEGVAKAGLKFGGSISVSTGDDDRVRTGKSGTVNLSLKLGNDKLAEVDGSVSATFAKGKTFRSFDKFVASEVEKVLDSKIGKDVFNQGYISHKALQNNLRRLGVGPEPVRIATIHRPEVVVVKTQKTGTKGGVGISISQRFRGELEGSETSDKFTKSMKRLDAVKENPNLLKQVDRNKVSFRFGNENVGGDKATEIEHKIFNLRKDQNRSGLDMLRTELETAILDLGSAYENFVQFRNKQDEGKEGSGDARAGKKSIKNDAKVQTTTEYLSAATDTYLVLRDLYRQTLPESEGLERSNFNIKMEAFEEKLLNPEFSNAEVPTQKYRAEGTTNSFSTNLSGTLIGNLSLDGTVTKTTIEGDGNPDNDGEYLTFELSLGGSLQGMDVISELDSKSDFFTAIGAGLGFGESEKFKLDFDKDLISLDHDFDWSKNIGIEGGKSFKMTGNFIKSDEDSYKLQYLRFTDEGNFGLSVSDIPVQVSPGVDLLLGASFEKSSTKVLGEVLGEDTLTYIQTKFNTWHTGDRDSESDWNTFIDSHKESFDKIFENIMKPDSTARKEILNTYKELDQKPGRLLVAIENYTNIRAEDTYQTVKQELFNYMEKQNTLHTAEVAKRFKPI